MTRRIARFIINFCDTMDGYVGQEIGQAIVNGLMFAPVMLAMMYIFVAFS